jgi:arylsulfatase A-like enzyme
MDDFSFGLLPTMRNAEAMANRGATYPNAFVVDSLCCPSRTATFTGQYPHQTGVLTNSSNLPNDVGPIGGWPAFEAHGDNKRSFALHLQEAGYTTGFVGKFLNEYEYVPGGPVPPAPLGWSDLRVVFGSAYNEWDFDMTYVEDGTLRVRHVAAPPAGATDAEKDTAYAGTVIGNQALGFIRRHRDSAAPYFLEVAPYGTHNRTDGPAYADDPLFPPAMRDRPGHGVRGGNCGPVACRRLGVGDLPGFGDPQGDNAPRFADGSPAPAWNVPPTSLTARAASVMLRDRAWMAQSVDRMLGRILKAVGPDTYVVLTSDNGLHLGQHGLGMGKGTAYDSDIHVPLVVVGPGVKPGPRPDVVSNIDLAPTFEELAGLYPRPYRSGRSLVGSLLGQHGRHVRRSVYAFVEHTWSLTPRDDPDRPFTSDELDKIPSYVAVRSKDALLVRDDLDFSSTGTDYAYEFYDLSRTPWERTNVYGDPRYADQVSTLMAKLAEFDRCAAQQRVRPVVTRMCRNLTLAGP